MTNQPFITTDELREEWKNAHLGCCGGDYCPVSRDHDKEIADFWLQKMSEQKERLIKEVSDKKRKITVPLITKVKTQEDLWKATTTNYDMGYNQALEDILRRLQSG